jgi:hypothetical protein
MRLRTWIINLLGGDRPVDNGGDTTEVGYVELWRSELVIAGLAERDIRAVAVPESRVAQPGAIQREPMARIFVASTDRLEALQVIDHLTRPDYGPTDD